MARWQNRKWLWITIHFSPGFRLTPTKAARQESVLRALVVAVAAAIEQLVDLEVFLADSR